MYNIYFKYCAGLQCCFVLAEISMDAESVISNSVKTVYYICLIEEKVQPKRVSYTQIHAAYGREHSQQLISAQSKFIKK